MAGNASRAVALNMLNAEPAHACNKFWPFTYAGQGFSNDAASDTMRRAGKRNVAKQNSANVQLRSRHTAHKRLQTPADTRTLLQQADMVQRNAR